MAEPRIKVRVQKFLDRDNLMLQWNDPVTGRRKSQSAGTNDVEEAEQARGDREYKLNNGLLAEPSKVTWQAFREAFEEEHMPGVRPRTRRKHNQALDLFEELVSPRALHSINERTIAAFLAGMRKRPVRGRVGMAPGTMHVYLQHRHTALSYAKSQKLMAEVPTFPHVSVPKKNPQPVPTEAFERLLDKAPGDDWRALMLTAWLAGLRAGECYALRWKASDKAPWIDFGRNRSILPAEFAKAREDQWITMAPDLRDDLESLPRTGPHVFALLGTHGQRLALSSVCDKVTKLAARAGVKLSLHPLRRGFGCRYAGEVPAQVLQRLMRHASITTTMQYYANIDEAVESAIMGSRKDGNGNTPCNSDRTAEGRREDRADATAGDASTCD
jgi:integrase